MVALKATFLGHACWLIETGGQSIIIDPFLSGNPNSAASPDSLNVDFVLVTHAHGDHIGDAVSLARANDALVISTFEVANLVSDQGARSHGMHIGGTFDFTFGTVRVTPAFHGSGVEGGHAAGFVISTPEGSIYHAVDTSLFGDMKLLNGVVTDRIDIAFLPIGSNFTMGIRDAAIAAEWIHPRFVMPMHFNTFDVIQADPDQFKKSVEARTDTQVVVLAPGESFSLN